MLQQGLLALAQYNGIEQAGLKSKPPCGEALRHLRTAGHDEWRKTSALQMRCRDQRRCVVRRPRRESDKSKVGNVRQDFSNETVGPHQKFVQVFGVDPSLKAILREKRIDLSDKCPALTGVVGGKYLEDER